MFLFVSVHFGNRHSIIRSMYMTEKTSFRNMPKTLLTTFWLADDVMIASSLTGWQSFQLKWCSQRHYASEFRVPANGRIDEGLEEREEIQSARNPIAPGRCSLVLLLVHATVCRSTLVTLKYRECHCPLRKQANSFRHNKSII